MIAANVDTEEHGPVELRADVDYPGQRHGNEPPAGHWIVDPEASLDGSEWEPLEDLLFGEDLRKAYARLDEALWEVAR